MIAPLIAFTAALLLSLVLTYKVRGWAPRIGLLDIPDGVRRVHERPIPRTGGVAIFGAVVLALALAWVTGGLPGRAEANGAGLVLKLMAGGAGMFLLGLWGDVRNLASRLESAGQTVVTGCAFGPGVGIETLSLSAACRSRASSVSASRSFGWSASRTRSI